MQNWLAVTARMRKAGSSTKSTVACHVRPTHSSHRLRLEALEDRRLLSAYYVSPNGSDSNNGTSQSTPWKTIAKVNSADLNPGDSVNFQGGATFSGSTPLIFQISDSGTPTNPVRITSYGTGRATISISGNNGAVEGQHVSGYQISNINFRGSGVANNSKTGIHFYSYASGALEYVHIDHVEVSGFGQVGIGVQASNGISTFRDIEVVNSDLSGNKLGGFETIGPGAGGNHSARTIFNVYLANLRVFNNAGISFGSVDGGVLERSISANNGYSGDVPTGVFVYDSSNVIIRNNELYGMENYATGTDGNGITFDFGTTNCIAEGNYTHDNGGAGILLVGLNKPGVPATTNNIVRYNISEDDGRIYAFAGISAYRGVSNAEIYGNTVYTTQRDAFQIWDWKGSGIHVRNNIFVTNGGQNNWLVNVFPPSDSSQKLGDLDLVFQGNNYYSSGKPFNIHYGNDYYFSLSSWRNGTGQEKLFGLPVGTSINPLLNNPGGGGTIGNPDLLDNLEAYKLQPMSRLRNLGLNLSLLFGIDTGDWDFFNNPLPSGPTIAVGAHDPSNLGRATNDEGVNGQDFLQQSLGITIPFPASRPGQTRAAGNVVPLPGPTLGLNMHKESLAAEDNGDIAFAEISTRVKPQDLGRKPARAVTMEGIPASLPDDNLESYHRIGG